MGTLSHVRGTLQKHRYGLGLGLFLGAAALTGLGCVWFMWAFEFVMKHRLSSEGNLSALSWIATPLLFVVAVEMIRRAAPFADGSGIPQAIYAARHLKDGSKKLVDLVSLRTMAVKVAAVLLGLWAGASTGREGPTVHVAACLFFAITYFLHKLFRLPFDMRSAVIAGGAAGLAAAFNTPLAGVTFAIEELSTDYFTSVKEVVLMAIIVAGIAAKYLTGDYVYFGRLDVPASLALLTIVSVGLLGGAAGAVFSTALWKGRRLCMKFDGWKRYALPAALGLLVLAVAKLVPIDGVLGPGNGAAQNYLQGMDTAQAGVFCLSKALSTLFTYWSGIAGGIFAPCLAMGAALGGLIGGLLHSPVSAAALIGMAAFLSGAIQAPITSFVIIFEMTGHHDMMLPIMLASLIGFMTSHLLGTKHLYQTLAGFYEDMLRPPALEKRRAHGVR